MAVKEHGLATGCAFAALLLAAIVSGCQQPPVQVGPSSLAVAVDRSALERDLHWMMDKNLAETEGTATEIASSVDDRRVRENSLRWKIRAFDDYLAILAEEDPRVAFIYQWASAAASRQYLVSGPGEKMFGSQQAAATDLVKKIEADTIALGKRYFPPEAIDAAEDEIETLAGKQWRRTPFGAPPATPVFEGDDDVKALLRIPFLPMSTLEGVSNTPKEIGRFTDTAKEFSAVVQHLPLLTRWQAELLLMEMEQSGPVVALGRELQNFQKGLRETADSVKSMPADMRAELEKALASIEKNLPQTKEIVSQAQAAVGQAKSAVETAKAALADYRVAVGESAEASKQLTVTVKAAQDAAAEVRGILSDYRKLLSAEEATKDAEPAAKQYSEMAASITVAAKEVRALLSDAKQPLADQSGLRQVAGDMRGLIDTIFWRAAGLLVLAFALALVYRRLVRRKIKDVSPDGPPKV